VVDHSGSFITEQLVDAVHVERAVGGVGGVGGVEFDLLIRVVSLAEYCSMKGQLLRFDETPLLCLVTDTVRHLYVDSALVVEHHPNPVLELVSRSKKSAQELVWASIGNVLTTIRICESHDCGVLVPWNSWRHEFYKPMGKVPIKHLVERNRVSKPLEGYTQNTQNVAALKRARDQDLAVHPGQDIQYVVDDDEKTLARAGRPRPRGDRVVRFLVLRDTADPSGRERAVTTRMGPDGH